MYLIIYSFIFTGWALLDNQVDCENWNDMGSLPNEVEFSQSPYVVLAYVMKTGARCTGAVIADNYVLTAAHCYLGTNTLKGTRVFYGRSKYTNIQLSSPEAKFVDAVDVLLHPQYEVEHIGTKLHADLAIIELTKSITDDEEDPVRVVTLGGPWPYDHTFNLMIMGCAIIGYGFNMGTVNETKLFRAEVAAVHDRAICRCVTQNIVCCRNPNNIFCKGQSGFPLICQRQLFGIASYNIENRRCRAPGSPGEFQANGLCDESPGTIFTYICPFLVWINDVIETEDITAAPLDCKAHIIHSNTYIIYIFSVFIIAYMW